MGYVYFITDGQGHIKIGKANHIPSRLKELQCGNAYELKVIDAIHVSIKRPEWIKPSSVEHQIHDLFRKYRIHDEWFSEEPVVNWLNGIRQNTLNDSMKFFYFGVSWEKWTYVYEIKVGINDEFEFSYVRKFKRE